MEGLVPMNFEGDPKVLERPGGITIIDRKERLATITFVILMMTMIYIYFDY